MDMVRDPKQPAEFPMDDDMFGKCSQDCIAFLRKMLNKDPSKRPTAAEAL